MFLTLVIIIFAAWIVGLALFELAGRAIHLMIVLSVVALIFRMMCGRSARAELRPSTRAPTSGVTSRSPQAQLGNRSVALESARG
jgi:membrane protein implicated in regulation of membrane protease activity